MATKTINVDILAKMFLAGAQNIEAKKDYINELNVFPVPDGDTGTNMSMTIMSAAKEVTALNKPAMKDLAKAISSGSLRGARNDDVFKSTEAIIYSMTREERGNPAIINPSRKRRIAKGAGVDISEVNKLIKQFEQSKKMMKQMSGMMGGKGKRRRGGMPKLPFGF